MESDQVTSRSPFQPQFFYHSVSYSYPSKLCGTPKQASEQQAFNKAVTRVFTLKRSSGLTHSLFTSWCKCYRSTGDAGCLLLQFYYKYLGCNFEVSAFEAWKFQNCRRKWMCLWDWGKLFLKHDFADLMIFLYFLDDHWCAFTAVYCVEGFDSLQ